VNKRKGKEINVKLSNSGQVDKVDMYECAKTRIVQNSSINEVIEDNDAPTLTWENERLKSRLRKSIYFSMNMPQSHLDDI
jgi:hypothetical protein